MKCQACLPRWKIHFATFDAHGESHQLLIHQNRLLSMSDVILALKSYDDDSTKCNSFCKPRHSKTWCDILDPEGGLGRSLTSIHICYHSVKKNGSQSSFSKNHSKKSKCRFYLLYKYFTNRLEHESNVPMDILIFRAVQL